MENLQIAKREKTKEQNRIYWAKHSKEINERRKERMICSCGMEICKRFLNSHLMRSNHSKELQKLQDVLAEKTNINIAKLITDFLI